MIKWNKGYTNHTQLGDIPEKSSMYAFYLRDTRHDGVHLIAHVPGYHEGVTVYKNIASAKRAARRIYAAAYPKHALQWSDSPNFADSYFAIAADSTWYYVTIDKARNGYAALCDSMYITDKRYRTADKAKAVAESHNRKRK